MRVGQKNKLTYRWARTGSRPRAVHDQRTQSTYLFGAVCPEYGKASGLVLPVCNAEAMQQHLDDIAAKVAPRAHAILIFDQASWHGAKSLKTPANISLIPLPLRAPELNPQENIWQFMRTNSLSNRVLKSYGAIVDHCCYACNTLVDQPWKIMSIARRDWAAISQSMRIGINLLFNSPWENSSPVRSSEPCIDLLANLSDKQESHSVVHSRAHSLHRAASSAACQTTA